MKPTITISSELFGDVAITNGDEGVQMCRAQLGSAIRELARETHSDIVIIIIRDDTSGHEEQIRVPVL